MHIICGNQKTAQGTLFTENLNTAGAFEILNDREKRSNEVCRSVSEQFLEFQEKIRDCREDKHLRDKGFEQRRPVVQERPKISWGPFRNYQCPVTRTRHKVTNRTDSKTNWGTQPVVLCSQSRANLSTSLQSVGAPCSIDKRGNCGINTPSVPLNKSAQKISSVIVRPGNPLRFKVSRFERHKLNISSVPVWRWILLELPTETVFEAAWLPVKTATFLLFICCTQDSKTK